MCNKDRLKKSLSSYVPFLLGVINVESSYTTFSIFNNSTFFGITEKTNEK